MKQSTNFNHAIALCLIGFLASVKMEAQSFDEYKQQMIGDFNAYKRQMVSDFKEYRDKINAEMEAYIRTAWQEMPERAPKPKPLISDDDIKPVIVPNYLDNNGESRPVIPDEIISVPAFPPAPEPIVPIEEINIGSEKRIEFTVYGTECSVRFDLLRKPEMHDSSEKSVGDMWHELCSGDYDNLYFDCLTLRKELCLCDWAYVKFVEALAREVYSSLSVNEAVVLQSVILLQSGFKLIMGRADDTSLHMLLASDCDIYGYPYYEVNGEHFYLTDGSNADKMYFMTELPDELSRMCLTVVNENNFTARYSDSRVLSSKRFSEASTEVFCDENLIAFYNDYPECYVNNDSKTRWRFYAQAPLSGIAKSSLYPALNEAITGRNELEAVNILLNFVQTAFVYEYDDIVWGRDRAFFPDETLYYPYCDCEDRAILFSRIVRDLTGLDVVLIYYPGHLATAVRFKDDVIGDYVMVNDEKYTICDPTIIGAGAPVGVTMSGMENNKAVIIEI